MTVQSSQISSSPASQSASPISHPTSDGSLGEFIVYACPTGDLARQLAAYFEKSQAIALNQAHDYMPHCTLTGFFHDQEAAISIYCTALERALAEGRPDQPDPAIAIRGLTFHPNWHGLELESAWIKRLMASFARQARSTSRQDALRLKDWLHLSLAYGFDGIYHESLKHLAVTLVNPAAPVGWELRFYQRCRPEGQSPNWVCHQFWKM